MTSSQGSDYFLRQLLKPLLELELEKGHCGWSFSALAKRSGMTRGKLYYHLGSDKEAIIEQIVNFVSNHIAGYTQEKIRFYLEKKYSRSVLKSRSFAEEFPLIATFYFLHRNQNTFLGKLIREKEKQALETIFTLFEEADEETCLLIYCFHFGFVFSPFIPEDDIDNYLQRLLPYLMSFNKRASSLR